MKFILKLNEHCSIIYDDGINKNPIFVFEYRLKLPFEVIDRLHLLSKRNENEREEK